MIAVQTLEITSDLLAFPNSWKELNDTDGPQVFSCAAGVEIIAAMQEKATELMAARQAQKVRKTGRLQPFLAVLSQECVGQLPSFEPT